MANQTPPASFTVVVVTGSIAASNAAGLVSVLRERLNEDIVAVVTCGAMRFVSIDTLRFAGGAAAIVTDSSSVASDQPDHIWLASQMSGLLVYPASANFIARTAAGLATDVASLAFLACHQKRRMIVPSMNPMMWTNPLVQRNIACLKQYGVNVVMPRNGLAPEISSIVDEFCALMRDSAK